MEPIKEGGLEMLTKDVLVGPRPDNVFLSLVRFNVEENYFRRTVAVKTKQGLSESTGRAHEGDERERELIGILMLKHRRGIQSHSIGPITYNDQINPSELGVKLVRESKTYIDDEGKKHPYKDGGYVIKLGKNETITISDKYVFHNYLTTSIRNYNKANPKSKIKNFSKLAEMLVPADFSSSDSSSLVIGSKSQMALAAGDSYLIKQTVYDGTEVGKVVKMGKMLEGIDAEFFLYKIPDSEMEKYAHLDNESFFNPEEKVIGILRTYKPDFDKSVRNEYVITPKDIGIGPETVRQYTKVKTPLRVAVETYGMQTQL